MNCFEVLRYTQEIESGRFREVALNRTKRMEYRDHENHLVRYIHNFLAAAKTMIDHTRNLMKSDFISQEHSSAYQAEVERVFSDDLARFISDFRNYTVHYGVPRTAHSYSLMEDKCEVALVLSGIKEWDGWKSKSRAFLNSHPNEIRLLWLVGSYQKKAMDFNVWFVKSFTMYYGELFREYDSITGE